MKISHAWLQEYFKKPLPDPEKLADLITFHTFEVEGIEKSENGPVIDISVLPNRSHDCLSYEGMAREIGVLLGKRVVPHALKKFPKGNTRKLSITVEEEKLCPRYTGMLVENIQVGPSPARIRKHLESIGQRSINNVVDIMNFVMFETGQPLHAFDADKLVSESNSAHITVRKAKAGEKMMTLDNKDVELNENVLVIADDENVLAIAGIKGGKKAEVTGDTKNIVIESANFSGSNIRKTSKEIGIRTDASIRFEHGITPEKTKDAILYVASLLGEFAAGPGFVAGKIKDAYPRPMSPWKVGVSLTEINRVLGTAFIETKVVNILKKFHFEFVSVIPHEEVVRLAPSFIGIPYVRGASVSFDAPKAFDCSSFVSYLYAQAGISLPRISVDIYAFSQKISQDELLPGDIVFSNTGEGNIHYETIQFMKGTKVTAGVDHCGIYLGEGKIIHCTESKGGVVVEELRTSEKFKNVVGCGRVAVLGESRFVVTAPSERLDLRIKEDLIEEIGRIYGYEKVVASKPVMEGFAPIVNKNFYYTDTIRAILSGLGFSEISTYAFTETGEVEVENPIASDKKFLRTTLAGNMEKSLELNIRNLPILALDVVKLFEIGKVFEKGREYISLCLGVTVPPNMKKKSATGKDILFHAEEKLSDELGVTLLGKTVSESVIVFDLESVIQKLKEPAEYAFPEDGGKEIRYRKISSYPFALRDIAVFVPSEISASEILEIIKNIGGELLVREKLFDVFEKTFEDGTKKTSYAFRLVFQSQEKTLSDEEVNLIMDGVTRTLNEKDGWKVR